MRKLYLTGPTPVAHQVGNAFIPAILHQDLPGERFPRKAKLNPNDAITYAACVLWWRQRRQSEQRRKLESLSSPTWWELTSAPEETQQAYWATLLASWQQNVERELDADVAFDHGRDRREMWGCGQ
jgi:hypothetical protein